MSLSTCHYSLLICQNVNFLFKPFISVKMTNHQPLLVYLLKTGYRMLTCKYTNDPDFRCLEDIRETSAELS